MRHAKATILVASLMALLIAPPLYAAGGCCGGGPGFGPMGKGNAIWGDLSKDQQQQVSALRMDFLKKQEALRSDLSKKHIEMMELTSKDNPDDKAIQKNREEIWALQDQMRNEGRAMQTKLQGLLTPEQRAKLGTFGPGFRCPMGMGGCGAGLGAAGCCQGRGNWQGGSASL